MTTMRRTALLLTLILVGLAITVVACQPSTGTTPAPGGGGVQVESYPGGTAPSDMIAPTPEGGYPGGVRPTEVPVPTFAGYPEPTKAEGSPEPTKP
jgi:hypothetical protein